MSGPDLGRGPDFDTSGEVPLRRARFRAAYRLPGCESCRAGAASGMGNFLEYAAEGWTRIVQCPICGQLWSDNQRSLVATWPEDAALELAGEPPEPRELPPILDVIAEDPGVKDDLGRWSLPPLPQGRYSGANGARLWWAESHAFVADVLMGVEPGSTTHRFVTTHREEVASGMPIRMDDYCLRLDIPLDWELLTSKVDLGRFYSVDAPSYGQRFVRAIGPNSRFYAVRGAGEIVTTART